MTKRQGTKRPSVRWLFELFPGWYVVTERAYDARVERARHLWAHPECEWFVLEKGNVMGQAYDPVGMRKYKQDLQHFETTGKLQAVSKKEAQRILQYKRTRVFSIFVLREAKWKAVQQFLRDHLPVYKLTGD